MAIEAQREREVTRAWMVAGFASAAFAGKLPSLEKLLSKEGSLDELARKRAEHEQMLKGVNRGG